ncbi:hypothetical protein E1212_23435 [Jiangella ureilytica]|uniref:NADH:flavin oxidoreductase/NADH oxidase N-terminal domain-containing protein n=1 Tax=Jiangella ureilytica TaxID=2530374 RepID=A0A4R4RH01_9ACTN|nr:hypothetical protein E1212_23435 [Jiangella ureilytica]
MVMAPMTSNRADEDGVVSPLTVIYYQQRARAGLIIAESTHESADGRVSVHARVHTDAQAEGRLRVTDAVHSTGGRIFLKLFHSGMRDTALTRCRRDHRHRGPIPACLVDGQTQGSTACRSMAATATDRSVPPRRQQTIAPTAAAGPSGSVCGSTRTRRARGTRARPMAPGLPARARGRHDADVDAGASIGTGRWRPSTIAFHGGADRMHR